MTKDDKVREAVEALERGEAKLRAVWGSSVEVVSAAYAEAWGHARAALAALSAATEGDAPPPTDERVQLLERLLGHEAGLICAWAKEPATHEAKLKAWAEVLERRVPDAPPPEPKPAGTEVEG